MVERKTEVIILTSVMGVLAIAAVMLRFTARRIKRSPLESDDYTILAALVEPTIKLMGLRVANACQLLVIGVCISTLIGMHGFIALLYFQTNTINSGHSR